MLRVGVKKNVRFRFRGLKFAELWFFVERLANYLAWGRAEHQQVICRVRDLRVVLWCMFCESQSLYQ